MHAQLVESHQVPCDSMILRENTQTRKHVRAVKDEETWHFCVLEGPHSIKNQPFFRALRPHVVCSLLNQSEQVGWVGVSSPGNADRDHQLELELRASLP